MRSFVHLVQRISVAGVVVATLVSLTGCAGFDLLNRHQEPEVAAATEADPIANIVCIWEPAEGQGVDGLPTRGFAGQILFFTRTSASPVKVEGDVRIYEFDDHGTMEERAKPLHQFDFLGETWTRHFRQSTLGPSYHVFIPYMRKGPWQANCSLRVRLTPHSGAPVYSDTTQISLPGPVQEVARPKAAPEVAKFTKSANLAQVAPSASLNRNRLSGTDLRKQAVTTAAGTQTETATQVAEIDLTAGEESATPRTSNHSAPLSRSEIQRIIREARDSRPSEDRQAVTQSTSTPAVSTTASTIRSTGRRYRFTPAATPGKPATSAAGIGVHPLATNEHPRQLHPLADIVSEQHPLAAE